MPAHREATHTAHRDVETSPMPNDTLNLRLARELFGWAWRADWQAWCPPEWPSQAEYARRQDSPRFIGALFAVLATHGTAWQENGTPHIPAYDTDPVATAQVWAYLWAHPGVQAVHLWRSGRRFACTLSLADGYQGIDRASGGKTAAEALSQAAFALAQGLWVATQKPWGRDSLPTAGGESNKPAQGPDANTAHHRPSRDTCRASHTGSGAPQDAGGDTLARRQTQG